MKRLFLALALLVGCLTAASAQYPLVSIDSLQYVENDSLLAGITRSRYHGDTVRVQGVVRFNPYLSALSTSFKNTYVEMAANGVWKGMNVRLANLADSTITQFFDNFQPGNAVEFTGIVGQFPSGISGETQIDLIGVATTPLTPGTLNAPNIRQVSDFSQLDPITSTQVQQFVTGEPWEGTYVEIQNVTVTNVQPQPNGRIFWDVVDANGNALNVRDVSAILRSPYASATNPNAPVYVQSVAQLSYIRGVIVEYGVGGILRYGIAPLDSTDIGPAATSPAIIDSLVNLPIVPTSSQTVDIFATVNDLDGTVATVQTFYSVGLNNANYGAWVSLPMTEIYSGRYKATVPAQANGSYVKYYIRAVDNQGNVSFRPDSLGTGSVYVVRNGGITNISDIQTTVFAQNAGNSIYSGKRLTNMNVEAVAMSRGGSSIQLDLGMLFLQDDTNRYSGIAVVRGESGISTIRRGDRINITAADVIDINTPTTGGPYVTTLANIQYTVISSGNALYNPVFSSPLDSVRLGRRPYAEAYESMLLQYNNVTVNTTNADTVAGSTANFGEFAINYTSTGIDGLRVDDFSPNIPDNFNKTQITEDQTLAFVRGILVFTFGNWKLFPRNLDDIAGFTAGGGFEAGLPSASASIMSVYPNPASELVTVQLADAAEAAGATATFYTMQGQVVNSTQLQGLRTDLGVEGLAEGTYLLRVTAGGKSDARVVVIAR